jgi:hypothetical protein
MDNDDQHQKSKITDLDTVPEVYSVPTQLLEKWYDIDPNYYLSFRLTRQDVDKIYASVYKLARATESTQQCLINWSNGRTDDANHEMAKAQKLTAEAVSDARQVMAAVMVSTIPGTGHKS